MQTPTIDYWNFEANSHLGPLVTVEFKDEASGAEYVGPAYRIGRAWLLSSAYGDLGIDSSDPSVLCEVSPCDPHAPPGSRWTIEELDPPGPVPPDDDELADIEELIQETVLAGLDASTIYVRPADAPWLHDTLHAVDPMGAFITDRVVVYRSQGRSVTYRRYYRATCPTCGQKLSGPDELLLCGRIDEHRWARHGEQS